MQTDSSIATASTLPPAPADAGSYTDSDLEFERTWLRYVRYERAGGRETSLAGFSAWLSCGKPSASRLEVARLQASALDTAMTAMNAISLLRGAYEDLARANARIAELESQLRVEAPARGPSTSAGV